MWRPGDRGGTSLCPTSGGCLSFAPGVSIRGAWSVELAAKGAPPIVELVCNGAIYPRQSADSCPSLVCVAFVTHCCRLVLPSERLPHEGFDGLVSLPLRSSRRCGALWLVAILHGWHATLTMSLMKGVSSSSAAGPAYSGAEPGRATPHRTLLNHFLLPRASTSGPPNQLQLLVN